MATGFLRTGEDRTLLDKAISEAFNLSLNNNRYTLDNVLLHIKSVGKLNKFPNLTKLNSKVPGIILLNVGGVALFKLPYQEHHEKKKSKHKGKALF